MKHTGVLFALAAASVLGVAACGGGAGQAASAPSTHAIVPSQASGPSQSAVPSHPAQPGEPALIGVPRYSYGDLPGEAGALAKETVKADPQHFKAVSIHSVLLNGEPVAVIALVQVQPQYANLPEFTHGMLPGFAQEMAGSGVKTAQQTIHTEKVVTARSGSDYIYVWYHGSAVTTVTGSNGAQVHDFAVAYLRAAHP
jgi:hypothetical protein